MSIGPREEWDFDPARGEYVPLVPEVPVRCASCGQDLLTCEAVTLTTVPICGPCRDRVDALPRCLVCDGAFPANALRGGVCIPCTMDFEKEPQP